MSKSVLAKGSNGQFQLTITLPADKIKEVYQKVVEKAGESIEVPGFRKGKAPMDKVIDRIDRTKVVEQVLQKVLPEAYSAAIKENDLKPIMDPQLEVLSTEEGKDWQVRATAAEIPEVKLGDYKSGLKGLVKLTEIWTPDSAEKKKGEAADKDDNKNLSPEELRQKQVAKITQWLLDNVQVEPAEVLVNQQANMLLARLLDQIQQLGMTLEQYLASTNKKMEDLKAEYVQRAKQDLRLEFIVLEIGKQEKIKVEEKDIEKMVNESNDEKLKEALDKPQQKQQLGSVLFRQKIVERLVKLAG